MSVLGAERSLGMACAGWLMVDVDVQVECTVLDACLVVVSNSSVKRRCSPIIGCVQVEMPQHRCFVYTARQINADVSWVLMLHQCGAV